MSETYQRVTQTHTHTRHDDLPADNELAYIHVMDDSPGITRAQFVIQYVVGLISGLLLLRFLLALFGAYEANGFVSFLYGLTNPLIAPFRGLFSLDTSTGVPRFEIETLVATIFYILAGLGAMRALDVFRK